MARSGIPVLAVPSLASLLIPWQGDSFEPLSNNAQNEAAQTLAKGPWYASHGDIIRRALAGPMNEALSKVLAAMPQSDSNRRHVESVLQL